MADVKPQVFNPDHVMMHEHKEGELLNEFNQPILRCIAKFKNYAIR